MSHFKFIKIGLLFMAVTLLLASCKKDAKTNWDTEMLVPIANTNLSLKDLVKDSAIITNSDNSLTLSFKSSLFQFSLADKLIRIPDTAVGQRFTLDSLKLPNQSVNFSVSLGLLANNMLLNSGTSFLGQFILDQQGNSAPFPALSGFNVAPFHFDATQYFDSAVLVSGEIQIRVYNNLPIPISGATIVVTNTTDGSFVASQVVYPIGPDGDSTYVVIPLSGTRITSGLDIAVANLSTPGSSGNNVVIDTADNIELKIYATNMRVSEAWAKFPSQDIVSITEDITQEIGDRKFTYVDARAGFLHIYITSSIEEKLYLEYTLVGAYDASGNPLKQFTTVPAAPVGGTVTIDTLIDISGLAINLTGKDGTKFNTYTQRIIAHIDSSGITRHITTDDSLRIEYEITEVAPNYIKGYAGTDIISQVDSSDFDFLNIFQSGSIDLEAVNMNISVENGIGVDGEIRINSLTAESKNNGSRTLTGSILGQQLAIGRATDFPLLPKTTNFAVNNSNSNIKDLLGILPNKLKYDVQVKTNVAGNTQQYRDFAYLESALKLNLNAEIPLSLVANHLVLKDTFNFDLSQTNLNVAGISDGVINLIAKNKYPIEAVLTMIAYDENWVPVDTITLDTKVAAADLDATCRATDFKKSKIPLYITEDRMDNIKRARHAVITADFNSASNNATCSGQHLKIYSDYNLDITFTARFNYKINTRF
jgi:hypothetical protein